jgi:actin-related protein 3
MLGAGSAKPIKAKIDMPPHQRHLVWVGAAQFANHPGFKTMVHTREEYMERGPSIARSNIIFGEGM